MNHIQEYFQGYQNLAFILIIIAVMIVVYFYRFPVMEVGFIDNDAIQAGVLPSGSVALQPKDRLIVTKCFTLRDDIKDPNVNHAKKVLEQAKKVGYNVEYVSLYGRDDSGAQTKSTWRKEADGSLVLVNRSVIPHFKKVPV